MDPIKYVDHFFIIKTIAGSFAAGYMSSQFNVLGFIMGCGFTISLQYIPIDIKKYSYDLYENGMKIFIKTKINEE